MKFITLLPLVALSTSFVIPDEQINQQLLAENQRIEQESKSFKSFKDRLPSKDDIKSQIDDFKSQVGDMMVLADDFVSETVSETTLDIAISAANDLADRAKSSFSQYQESLTAFDAQGWMNSTVQSIEEAAVHPPHHGHNNTPNMTVYELIASSKYTTKLAALINEYDDLVELLNGTAANYTIFAPTDKAFEGCEHHKKPSKEDIKKLLAYHVSPNFYPASRVLASHTIPSALYEDSLSGFQRLRIGLGLKGLAVNFYARIIAINIFGTNGVIHGIDSILLPPPTGEKIIEIMPQYFSTLSLAIEKTGLGEELAHTHMVGGTLFAPSNNAFARLGPRINAFLFSKHGTKYLAALIKYHVVANQTLYSDAFYKNTEEFTLSDEVDENDIPKGFLHVDLPTLLDDKSLSVDIARYGGLINIKINGYWNVVTQDGIAKDGVIQQMSSVLIPPKTGAADYDGEEELTVEDLKERLEPFVEESKGASWLERWDL